MTMNQEYNLSSITVLQQQSDANNLKKGNRCIWLVPDRICCAIKASSNIGTRDYRLHMHGDIMMTTKINFDKLSLCRLHNQAERVPGAGTAQLLSIRSGLRYTHLGTVISINF